MDKSALRKLKLLSVVALGAWLVIWGRLSYLQLFCHQKALESLTSQQESPQKLSGRRGRVYDRNFIPLASDLNSLSLYALPDSVRNPEYLSSVLTEVLGINSDTLRRSLASARSFIWIKRKINPQQLVEFEQWKLRGIYIKEEEQRYYPKGEVGRSFLGYTDIDNRGIAGLEKEYDCLLKPQVVEVPYLRDARGGLYPLNCDYGGEIADGVSLMLTIDIRLQEIVEGELKQAVDSNGALSGMAIFMEPHTGEILALANYLRGREWCAYNKAIVDCFEPGSTFKLLTFASALENGVFQPDEAIHGEWGECDFPGITVHDHEVFGALSFRRSFEFSSNIASAKIANEVGWERFCQTLRSFGIGERTGIDLPGETKGVTPAFEKPDEVTLTTMAFGQGIAITAVRLICCYAVVASGGYAVRPHLVKKIINPDGEVSSLRTVKKSEAVYGERVLSGATVSTLVEFMEGVVDSGTAPQAQIYNLKVAGKTGTAQKPLKDRRGYKPGAYLASFVGFLPSRKPRLLGLVVIDEPKGQHYGGQVAAPVFKRIVEKVLVLPGYELEENGKRRSLESLTTDKGKRSEPLKEPESYSLRSGEASDFESQ